MTLSNLSFQENDQTELSPIVVLDTCAWYTDMDGIQLSGSCYSWRSSDTSRLFRFGLPVVV